MNIEEKRQRMMELWYGLEFKVKGDLANLWENRVGLGELEALVEELEPKVIQLLQVIPSLKRHSHEYHARTVDLVKLLHHFNQYKSSEEWIQKVTSDLEFMSTEIVKARYEAIKILQSRSIQKPTISYATQQPQGKIPPTVNVEIYGGENAVGGGFKTYKMGSIDGRYEGNSFYIKSFSINYSIPRANLIEIVDKLGFKEELVNKLAKSGRSPDNFYAEITCDFGEKWVKAPFYIRSPRQEFNPKIYPDVRGQVYLKEPISLFDLGSPVRVKLDAYSK